MHRYSRSSATVVLAGWLCSLGFSPGVEPAYTLREEFPGGYQYQVSTRVDLQGSLQLPKPAQGSGPRELHITGTASVEYAERVLSGETEAAPAARTLRWYDRLDFRRTVAGQLQESSLRPEVRRMVILRLEQTEVPFSPDGPLMWSEIDRVRTDVFVPALRGLLPQRPVQVGQQWAAHPAAAQELTDLDEISAGQLTCRLQEIQERNGQRLARVRLTGVVQGINEDGPNRQQLDGYYLFDLDRKFLVSLYLDGTSWLLDKENKPQGKVEGRFTLVRRPASHPELSDARIRHLSLEPTEDNTLLLFREPALGVEFVYPRRWTVRKADARQIVLDEPGGGGLLVTLEPLSQTPRGSELLEEARKTLGQQRVQIVSHTAPSPGNHPRGTWEQFQVQAQIAGKPWSLRYHVCRQREGGAVVMGRWPAQLDGELAQETQRIVQSLLLLPPRK